LAKLIAQYYELCQSFFVVYLYQHTKKLKPAKEIIKKVKIFLGGY